MSSYIAVSKGEGVESVELPAEEDETLLLSVLQSQFEGATGLKYRNPSSGSWRGVRIADGILYPPSEGWGDTTYIVVALGSGSVGDESGKKEREEERERDRESRGMAGYKRGDRHYSPDAPRSKSARYYPPSSPVSDSSFATGEDVIVLGLKWDVDEAELKDYFKQFGEVKYAEIKRDFISGKSRGFGFLRFVDPSVQESVMKLPHTIRGRRCELRPPRKVSETKQWCGNSQSCRTLSDKSSECSSPGHLPCKFFIGCLPNDPEATVTELTDYFKRYGSLSDVYIPKPYRGFGFVTYVDGFDAQRMCSKEHALRGYKLNITVAEPKTHDIIRGSGRDPPVVHVQTSPANMYAYQVAHTQQQQTPTYAQPFPQYYGYGTTTDNIQYTSGHNNGQSSYQ